MSEWMGLWWRGFKAVNRAGMSVGRSLAEDLTQRRAAAAVRPSRKAMQTGILAPGDGPPSGSLGSFLDYREVLLPPNVQVLNSGAFPIGAVVHPQNGWGEFPVFLDWEEVRRHLAVIGPAGTGKTYNVMVPLVVGAAESGLSTVVVDTKGDFLDEISAFKARHGITNKYPVVRWDIADPVASRSWNPLAEVTSANAAAQVALAFLGAVDPLDHQKSFAERDHRWLRGLVHLLVSTRGAGTHPQDLYALVVNQQAVVTLAQQAPQAATDIIDLVRFPPGDYAKATWALANRLSWLAEPPLSAMLSGVGPRAFTLSQVIGGGSIVKIGARISGGERTMTAAALMLNLLKIRCMEQFGQTPIRMLWVMDEAPKYANRIELDQILDFMRGAGVAACIGAQDVTQFGDTVAQERMLANADTLIAMKGVSAATAEFVSRRLGDVRAATTTTTLQDRGRWAPSISYETKPMLGSREIMQPPVGRYGGLVHIRGSSPHPFLVTFDR
jgi:type IV secretory pathway TraG/TraD family ATPase VirD4